MPVSMYSVSIPVFMQHLNGLSSVLDKAAAWATARKVNEADLLNMRLSPDMFNLLRQIRAVTDHAANAAGRLSGKELLKFANDETTIAQFPNAPLWIYFATVAARWVLPSTGTARTASGSVESSTCSFVLPCSSPITSGARLEPPMPQSTTRSCTAPSAPAHAFSSSSPFCASSTASIQPSHLSSPEFVQSLPQP